MWHKCASIILSHAQHSAVWHWSSACTKSDRWMLVDTIYTTFCPQSEWVHCRIFIAYVHCNIWSSNERNLHKAIMTMDTHTLTNIRSSCNYLTMVCRVAESVIRRMLYTHMRSISVYSPFKGLSVLSNEDFTIISEWTLTHYLKHVVWLELLKDAYYCSIFYTHLNAIKTTYLPAEPLLWITSGALVATLLC